MNVMAGAVPVGRAPGLGGGQPADQAARLRSAGRRQWPGASPWPLFSALGPVGALPTAPGLARAFTSLVLSGWEMERGTDLGEVSVLLVSELVSNVVQLAADGDGSPVYQADGRLTELWLRLMSDRSLLRVEVWDNLHASAGVPVTRRPGTDDEHGRGLAIVDQLSHRWGHHPIPGLPAKSVWALVKAQ